MCVCVCVSGEPHTFLGSLFQALFRTVYEWKTLQGLCAEQLVFSINCNPPIATWHNLTCIASSGRDRQWPRFPQLLFYMYTHANYVRDEWKL